MSNFHRPAGRMLPGDAELSIACNVAERIRKSSGSERSRWLRVWEEVLSLAEDALGIGPHQVAQGQNDWAPVPNATNREWLDWWRQQLKTERLEAAAQLMLAQRDTLSLSGILYWSSFRRGN